MSNDNTLPQDDTVETTENTADTQATDNATELSEATEPSIDSLTARVTELEKEVSDTKARANADMYNFQKRIERETENTKKFAIERFAKDLLEIIDNLERATEAAQQAGATDDDALLQGVLLTHKSLLGTLEKHKITVVNPARGDDFNADVHEAVGMDPEAESGKVGNVLQKGYQLQERLLRPAMVMVGA